MKQFRMLFFIFLIISCAAYAAVADVVIFSYNRPMQLYALLESMEACVDGVGQMHVIYRADTDAFTSAYDDVAADFDYVLFEKQAATPRTDFKPLTMRATFDSPSDYVIFAVDDIVVKDYVDLSQSIELLEQEKAYGVYLRLGLHLNWNYPWNQAQSLPSTRCIGDDVHAWTFSQGHHDWGYPNTVDMTLYRKQDIHDDFNRLSFTNPNTLEGSWAGLARKIMHRTGLCYALSKMVNLPLNRVQHTYHNRHMDEYSAQELLAIFNSGKKMDIAPLWQIENGGAHMEYSPTFTER